MKTDPLVSLEGTTLSTSPLVCIPADGASVTTFLDFVAQLERASGIYGLQPRGIDHSQDPQLSVEEAALFNVEALAPLRSRGPIHLIGHCHGGLVAFEMARCLEARRWNIGSLTLIDTEPPDAPEAATDRPDDSQIRHEFVEAFEKSYSCHLLLNAEKGITDIGEYLRALHAALVRTKCWSSRSTPDMLRRALERYSAARAAPYMPCTRYPGTVRLALPDDRGLVEREERTPHALYEERWRAYAANVDTYHARGDRFSMLQLPHVRALAQWWRQTVAPAAMAGRSTH